MSFLRAVSSPLLVVGCALLGSFGGAASCGAGQVATQRGAPAEMDTTDGVAARRAVDGGEVVRDAGASSGRDAVDGGRALRDGTDARDGRDGHDDQARDELARDAAALAARFATLDGPIAQAVADAKMPGCVVIVGRHDEVLFRRAYGSRSVAPDRAPMTVDTVFDLASLTKPVATATSVMILVQRGAIDLDARASHYVPELAKLPPFTVRQLLLHTSGLPAATPMTDYRASRAGLMARLAELKFKTRPGETFVYSDVGFIVLEEIVRRTSGVDLATFASREIFAPLGMKETGYLPALGLRARAAPTEQRDGLFMRGDVHDPRAWALGGVAGHAGVFSTADDLGRFARAMLGKGALDGHSLFAEKTFDTFVARRETSSGGRALGWDIDSRYASHKSSLLSARAFGHGGFTGTAMWIDPARDLFVVFLSNRVHPDGKGAVNPLIAEIASLAVRATDVRTGIDVLRDESFARLQGAHVGLVTNASARTQGGVPTIDAFRAAPGVKLEAIFSPEHGLGAEKEGAVADATYASVPVYSLYGEHAAPTPESLRGVDTIVFDLQDAGARFYTYASTMKRVMKVAGARGLRFVVLDRPNPTGGLAVEGPVLTPGVGTFVNHHPLPVRHGMTMGELARLFAADDHLDVRMDIVELQNWRRKDYFDHTGLAWVNPSPNLRTVRGAVIYPMLGLLEGTNLSVGRGTDEPFEVFGAPWLDASALLTKLEGAKLEGVTFEATTFTPRASNHAGKSCRGLRITVTDRTRFQPVRTAMAVALAVHELHPQAWDLEHVDRLLQSAPAMAALEAGKDVAEIEATWAAELASFRTKRERFLIYR